MNTVATNIQIRNFKSIKDLQFEAKKVNIFIGRPNVGKSNILEALSLLGAGYAANNPQLFLKDIVRYIKPVNLFFDEDYTKTIDITTESFSAKIQYFDSNEEICFVLLNGDLLKEALTSIAQDSIDFYNKINLLYSDLRNSKKIPESLPLFSRGSLEAFHTIQQPNGNFIPIKKYQYLPNNSYSDRQKGFLRTPFGNNLYEVLDKNDALFDEINLIFNSYNLSLELYPQDRTFEIIKRTGKKAYKYPYNHASDTLQRLIFYFAAIDSNTNSAIILEEPEVHSFPPYTASLAERIAGDPSNQYFIATHSPYLLESLINKSATDDIAVFLTYYENWETKVQRIPNDLIADYLNSDFDLFFNLLQIQESLQ